MDLSGYSSRRCPHTAHACAFSFMASKAARGKSGWSTVSPSRKRTNSCCAPPSCIAADGRRRPLGMNNDHLGAVLGGKFRTAVSGVRIHVNELDPVKAACGADGLQASRQALTFIASNYDNGEGL